MAIDFTLAPEHEEIRTRVRTFMEETINPAMAPFGHREEMDADERKQYFTAKELTVDPGAKCTINDKGASSAIVVQGEGFMNKLRISSPKMIGFNELTEDEVFITESAAKAGVTYENTSGTEPLVLLRYFGPEVNPDAPAVGDYLKKR